MEESAPRDAMSRQSQAERQRQARIIPGQAEMDISEKFTQAAHTYQNNPVAPHLRAMNMLHEAVKERGAMAIVPSSAVEPSPESLNRNCSTVGTK